MTTETLPTPPSPEDAPEDEGPGEGRRSILDRLRRHFLAIVVATLLAGFVLYEVSRQFFAYSSDAYVMTDVVTLAPAVSGHLVELKVRNNQDVHQGDDVFVIDPRPFQHEVDLRKAALALRELERTRARDLVAEAKDDYDAAAAALKDAEATQARIQDLVDQGYSAQQRLDDVNRVLNEARAEFNRAKSAIDVARNALEESAPQTDRARAQLALAEYNLAMSRVTAPASGHVAPFTIREGDYIEAGQPVLTIVKDDAWRLVVNLREQHLANLKVGQTTWLMMSSRPWQVYRGTVKSIARGISRSETPSRTLPYVAPTTEWIRLSRRFPVEIDIGSLSDQVPLYMGADARVLILH